MEKLTNILVIEDDPITGYLHKMLIEGFDVAHHVELADDGEKAIQLIKHFIASNSEDEIPELILLDLNMPLMDGFQFLEAYQHLDFKNKESVVVAVLTSSFSRKDKSRVKEYPVVKEYLVKPLTEEKVMGLMERHFGWHSYTD